MIRDSLIGGADEDKALRADLPQPGVAEENEAQRDWSEEKSSARGFSRRLAQLFASIAVIISLSVLAGYLFGLEAWHFEGLMARTLSAPIFAAILYQSLAVTAFGFVSWNTLLGRFGASTLHSFVFIMPVAGVLFSGLLLAEPITSRLLAAALLITAGILVIHLRRAPAPARIPVDRGW